MIIDKWTDQAYRDAINAVDTARSNGQPIEISIVTPQRTKDQNRYYRFCLRWVASQYGCDVFEMEKTFKQVVNPDIFVREMVRKDGKTYTIVRSSADLDWKEMSSAISNFRSYALSYMGLRIPEPDDDDGIRRCKIEIDKVKQYI